MLQVVFPVRPPQESHVGRLTRVQVRCNFDGFEMKIFVRAISTVESLRRPCETGDGEVN